MMEAKVTIPALLQMKRDGRKSVGVVAWDYQIARIADRAGVDIVSVGDSVGVNLWGHSNPLEVTMEEMLVVCKAVRRGVTRALVSCDFPFGPLQESTESAVRAAIRLVKEGKFVAEDYGVYSTMKHKGSELAPLGTFAKKVPADTVSRVQAKQAEILAGTFVVKVDDTQPKSTAK